MNGHCVIYKVDSINIDETADIESILWNLLYRRLVVRRNYSQAHHKRDANLAHWTVYCGKRKIRLFGTVLHATL